jgi:hypothetical protein
MSKRARENNGTGNGSVAKRQKMVNLSKLHEQTKNAMNKHEILKELAYIHMAGIGMQNLQYNKQTVRINSTQFLTRCVENKFCRLRASYLSNLIQNMYKYAPRTTSNIVVYRAFIRTAIGDLFNINNVSKSTIYSPVPFSTSMDIKFSKEWGISHSKNNFTLLKIIVPKGTPLLVLSKPPPNKTGMFNFLYREREVILPPGEMTIDWNKNINGPNLNESNMIINEAVVNFTPVIPTIIEHNRVATFTFNKTVVNERRSNGAKQVFTFNNRGNIIGNAPKYAKHTGYPISAALSAAVAHGVYQIAIQ